jgi:hypothetical protein
MEYEIIAEGIGTDAAALANAEAQLKEGDAAELRLYVENAPSPEALRAVESELIASGFVLRDNVAYDSGIIVIRYLKTTPPAPAEGIGVIPLMATGIIALVAIAGVVVFAWQMAKQAGSALSNPLLIFAAVALVIVWFMMRSPKNDKEAEQ